MRVIEKVWWKDDEGDRIAMSLGNWGGAGWTITELWDDVKCGEGTTRWKASITGLRGGHFPHTSITLPSQSGSVGSIKGHDGNPGQPSLITLENRVWGSSFYVYNFIIC